MSAHESSPNFDSTSPAISTSAVATESPTSPESDAVDHTPTALASDAPTYVVHMTAHPTHRPTKWSSVNTLKINTGLSIAVLACTLGLATAIEAPTFVSQLIELANGFVGLVCAGAVIVGGLVLIDLAEDVDTGVEGAWGMVWRWGKHCIRGEQGEKEEGDEIEEGWMSGGGGNVAEIAALQDSEAQSNVGLLGSATSSPFLRETRAMNSSPLLTRLECTYTPGYLHTSAEYSIPRRHADRDTGSPLISQAFAGGGHTSGLLGPSPMPPRRTDPDW